MMYDHPLLNKPHSIHSLKISLYLQRYEKESYRKGSETLFKLSRKDAEMVWKVWWDLQEEYENVLMQSPSFKVIQEIK